MTSFDRSINALIIVGVQVAKLFILIPRKIVSASASPNKSFIENQNFGLRSEVIKERKEVLTSSSYIITVRMDLRFLSTKE